MNKQEAIERIKNIDTLNINDSVAGQQVDMVIKNQVLDIISQIDEPQKVAIPNYVAEWIERRKLFTLYHVLNTMEEEKKYKNFYKWFSNDVEKNTELLASAWIYGYTVEKEPLYTVEIPNPNIIGNEVYVLMKNGFKQVVMVKKFGVDWKNERGFQLTEAEIKKDFEWAIKFARPVEE